MTEKKACFGCDWVSFKKWAAERLEYTYKENIPLDSAKDLDFGWWFSIGFIFYASYIALFIFFMYQALQSALDVKYVSLEEGPNCNKIPIMITNSYFADVDGNWIGENDFLYSRAAFQLVLTSFSVKDESDFEKMMTTFQDAFVQITTKTEQIGLIYSLLAWMSFVRYYSTAHPSVSTNFHDIGFGKLQYMQLTGTPSAVFNLRSTQFVLGSQRGLCEATVEAESLSPLYSITAKYNLQEFLNSSKCRDALRPDTFDMYSVTNKKFTLGLDTRSFSTAMSVNYGVISLNELALVANSEQEIEVNGVNYVMAQYFDIRYAAMDPIACFYNVSVAKYKLFQDTDLCFLIKGPYTLGLPTFNHVGAHPNLTHPAYCGCNTNEYGCNEFKLMSGLIVFPTDDTSDSTARDIVLMKKQMKKFIQMLDEGPYKNYEEFNRAAYNASFALSTSGFSDSRYSTSEYFNQSFEFCRSNYSDPSSDTCSLLLFYQYDYSNNFVSDYHFRLENISQDSSIVTSDASWDSLKISPVMLEEYYYSCNTTELDAWQQSQGIASGNIDMLFKGLIFIMSIVVYCYIYFRNKKKEVQEYRKDHREELGDKLMNILLRAMRAAEIVHQLEETKQTATPNTAPAVAAATGSPTTGAAATGTAATGTAATAAAATGTAATGTAATGSPTTGAAATGTAATGTAATGAAATGTAATGAAATGAAANVAAATGAASTGSPSTRAAAIGSPGSTLRPSSVTLPVTDSRVLSIVFAVTKEEVLASTEFEDTTLFTEIDYNGPIMALGSALHAFDKKCPYMFRTPILPRATQTMQRSRSSGRVSGNLSNSPSQPGSPARFQSQSTSPRSPTQNGGLIHAGSIVVQPLSPGHSAAASPQSNPAQNSAAASPQSSPAQNSAAVSPQSSPGQNSAYAASPPSNPEQNSAAPLPQKDSNLSIEIPPPENVVAELPSPEVNFCSIYLSNEESIGTSEGNSVLGTSVETVSGATAPASTDSSAKTSDKTSISVKGGAVDDNCGSGETAEETKDEEDAGGQSMGQN